MKRKRSTTSSMRNSLAPTSSTFTHRIICREKERAPSLEPELASDTRPILLQVAERRSPAAVITSGCHHVHEAGHGGRRIGRFERLTRSEGSASVPGQPASSIVAASSPALGVEFAKTTIQVFDRARRTLTPGRRLV
jgi:hypothetical protein